MPLRHLILTASLATLLGGCVVAPHPHDHQVYHEDHYYYSDDDYYDYYDTPSYEGYYYVRVIFIDSTPYYVDDDRHVRPIPRHLHDHFRRSPYRRSDRRVPVFSRDSEVRDGYQMSRVVYLNGVPHYVGDGRDARPLPSQMRERFPVPSQQNNGVNPSNRRIPLQHRGDERGQVPPAYGRERGRDESRGFGREQERNEPQGLGRERERDESRGFEREQERNEPQGLGRERERDESRGFEREQERNEPQGREQERNESQGFGRERPRFQPPAVVRERERYQRNEAKGGSRQREEPRSNPAPLGRDKRERPSSNRDRQEPGFAHEERRAPAQRNGGEQRSDRPATTSRPSRDTQPQKDSGAKRPVKKKRDDEEEEKPARSDRRERD